MSKQPVPAPNSNKQVASDRKPKVSIIGGGPAGLMASESLVADGYDVTVYESMPTLGRKFLRAGLGGLNITHSEHFEDFCKKYGDKQRGLQKYLEEFSPQALRDWVHGLGIETFVGTSGRVFPKEMKAAPLLRAWVHRLRQAGVKFEMNHRWLGFTKDGGVRFAVPNGECEHRADCLILALGGASWPQLGSTGCWTPWLQERGVEVSPWQAANCGFDVVWSKHLQEKFPANPLKSVTLTFTDLDGVTETRAGELLVKEYGVEGSLIYAYSRRLREYLNHYGKATFYLDLVPGRSLERVTADLSRPRGSKSMSRHLQNVLGDDALKRALIFELVAKDQMENPQILARLLKALPVTVQSARPIADAISTAGGVSFASFDENLMLKTLPGIFVAGEMLDWEAPTGGYLLTACFATGRMAGLAASQWLKKHHDS